MGKPGNERLIPALQILAPIGVPDMLHVLWDRHDPGPRFLGVEEVPQHQETLLFEEVADVAQNVGIQIEEQAGPEMPVPRSEQFHLGPPAPETALQGDGDAGSVSLIRQGHEGLSGVEEHHSAEHFDVSRRK